MDPPPADEKTGASYSFAHLSAETDTISNSLHQKHEETFLTRHDFGQSCHAKFDAATEATSYNFLTLKCNLYRVGSGSLPIWF